MRECKIIGYHIGHEDQVNLVLSEKKSCIPNNMANILIITFHTTEPLVLSAIPMEYPMCLTF